MPKKNDPWFVVVERANLAYNKRLKPYVVGPYDDEKEAADEADSESSIPGCLLTIDAKNEGYIADECYWTQTPPKKSIMITIDEDYIKQKRRDEAEYEEECKKDASCKHSNTRTFTHKYIKNLPTMTMCLDCAQYIKKEKEQQNA